MPSDRPSHAFGPPVLWFLLYSLLTIAVAEPFVDLAHLHDASYEGDSRLLIWTLAWDAHALLNGLPLFDANIYHPVRPALAYAEHHVGVGLFAAPVYALTGNPVLAYWTVWLLSFPLNALAMHALAWRVTRSHPASAAGALVYAFCFFRMHHAHGHLQLLWTWALPLVPLALERWLANPRWRTAGLLAALVLGQALSSWYLMVMVALLAAGSAIVLVTRARIGSAHLVTGLPALAASCGILWWFARPYFALTGGGRVEAAGNAADLTAYLLPPENTWLGQIVAAGTSLEPRWIWGESTLYVGIVTLVLAATGAARLRSGVVPDGRRLAAGVLAVAAVGLALSFGPSPSHRAPFDLFAAVPGMSLFRAPARFALLVMLGLALLNAAGAAWILRKDGAARRALLLLALAAGLGEAYVVDFPGGEPKPFAIPRIYRHLAQMPGGAVVSLPTYRATPEAFRESDYLLYSTAHWKPIVNGYGRSEPSGHGERLMRLARFPAPEAIRLMRDLDIRYVVLHSGRAREMADRAAAAAGSADVTLVAQFEGDYLFALR